MAAADPTTAATCQKGNAGEVLQKFFFYVQTFRGLDILF
jgi:hypothetical protein